MSTHTPLELNWFKRYKRVQDGGRYNMFDPRARFQTGLTRDEYMFVIKNYDSLSDADKATDQPIIQS